MLVTSQGFRRTSRVWARFGLLGVAFAAVLAGALLSAQVLRGYGEGGDLFAAVTGATLHIGKRLEHHAYSARVTASRILRGHESKRYDTVPRLRIHVSPQNLQAIIDKREDALKYGFLIADDGDFVAARIVQDNAITPVRIRLKGDLTDHYRSHKWSLRVQVRGNRALFGMRRFSLQSPATRNYQFEPLFLDDLRAQGVLAVRYFFVHVTLNDRDMGLMALEEHFSKELVESQGRREGVIVAFDETDIWKQKYINNRTGIPDAHRKDPVPLVLRSGPIKIYRAKKSLEDETLQLFSRQAIGLLTGYVEKTLAAEDVFDLALFAKFFVTSLQWYSYHGVTAHNLRFYYNPITRLLEPIGFDAMPFFGADDTAHQPQKWLERAADQFAGGLQLFSSRQFRRAVETEIKRRASSIEGQIKNVRDRERHYLDELRVEYRDLKPFDVERYRFSLDFLEKANLARYGTENERDFFTEPVAVDENREYASIMKVYRYPNDGGQVLEFQNLTTSPIRLYGIGNAKGRTLADVGDTVIPPGMKEPTGRPSLTLAKEAALPLSNPVVISAGFVSKAKQYRFEAFPAFRPFASAPFAAPKGSDWGSALPFLRKTVGGYEFLSGDWRIEEDLIFPAGSVVAVRPGTQLSFGPGTRMVVRGPLQVGGTSQRPVVFTAAEKEDGWSGVAVLQQTGSRSMFRHLHIDGVTVDPKDRWGLTGALTVHRGFSTIEDTVFHDIAVEDSLNLVNSRFQIARCRFENTLSDAIDSDFSKGTIVASSFLGIGGDALDFSGSIIQASDIKVDTAGDKAISVGEGSDFSGRSFTIANVGTAIASKDRSVAHLSASTIRGVKGTAFEAYMKKAEYGPARLVVSSTEATDVGTLHHTDRRSEIVIDGEAVNGGWRL
jgi:hypothetical protein